MKVTYSQPVKMAFRSTDEKEKFYRVVGRAGVRRARVRRRWLEGVVLALAVSALLWLGLAALVYLAVVNF